MHHSSNAPIMKYASVPRGGWDKPTAILGAVVPIRHPWLQCSRTGTLWTANDQVLPLALKMIDVLLIAGHSEPIYICGFPPRKANSA